MPAFDLTVYFRRLGAAVILTVFSAVACFAQEEPISLGDGTALTVNDYQIETLNDGYKTIVVLTTPNFDPEPHGQVPSDNFARLVQPLCGNLVANSAETIEAEEIDAVRIRWDFTPNDVGEDVPDGMTLTRFHEMVFEVTDDAPCIPRPLGVGLDNLSPSVSADIVPNLRWIEPGLTPGELSLTYEVEAGLEALAIEELDRAAIELCILHADLVLEDRARYYSQLYSRTVAITFVQDNERPGFQLLRRVIFPVADGRCQTGLSEMLTNAIREE